MHKEPRKVREFRRREQEILDTALKLFLDQGEDSVTVEMIADPIISEPVTMPMVNRLAPRASCPPK